MLQKFFLQRMISQRNLSPETIKSYRDSFKIFVRYMRDAHGIAPSSLTIEHLQAEYILGFLNNLEKARGNQPKTINNRLAAIHAFLRFLSFEKPEYSGLIARGLGVPFRKEEKRLLYFLTKDEMDVVLCQEKVQVKSGKTFIMQNHSILTGFCHQFLQLIFVH